MNYLTYIKNIVDLNIKSSICQVPPVVEYIYVEKDNNMYYLYASSICSIFCIIYGTIGLFERSARVRYERDLKQLIKDDAYKNTLCTPKSFEELFMSEPEDKDTDTDKDIVDIDTDKDECMSMVSISLE
jgi:hypothetical protein